jgi:hypothetical protein
MNSPRKKTTKKKIAAEASIGPDFFSHILWGGSVALLLCAMCYGESTTKEIKRIYPPKRGSQMRLNFSCMGFVRTDLSCR